MVELKKKYKSVFILLYLNYAFFALAGMREYLLYDKVYCTAQMFEAVTHGPSGEDGRCAESETGN